MLRRIFIALCLLVAAAANARAEVIIGNYPPANSTFATNIFDTNTKAVGFTMGTEDYLLEGAMLRMDYLTGTPQVELRADNSGSPNGGAVVATFSTPNANGGGMQDYLFTATPFTLLANTRYWLHVYGANSNGSYWYRSNPSIEPSGAGAAFYDYQAFSLGSWSGNLQYNTFELLGTEVSAVPEPTSFLLVAGLAAAGGVRRRFRRR